MTWPADVLSSDPCKHVITVFVWEIDCLFQGLQERLAPKPVALKCVHSVSTCVSECAQTVWHEAAVNQSFGLEQMYAGREERHLPVTIANV